MATVKDGVLIAQVRSSSDPGKKHDVRMLADKRWVCDCMAYRFTKGEVGNKPLCKHIKEVVRDIYQKIPDPAFEVVYTNNCTAEEKAAKKTNYKAVVESTPVLRRAIDY